MVAIFLAIVLDRFVTIRRRSLPVASVKYDGGGLMIGGVSLTFGGLDNLRTDVELSVDATNRVHLSSHGASFVLGPRLDVGDGSGRPDIEIGADPNDSISLTSSQSMLGWPTPFEFKIMGGPSPWWKRYVYYRLLWRKQTSETLDMRWRYEQHYYSAKGWSEPAMLWMSRTGLTAVEIGKQ